MKNSKLSQNYKFPIGAVFAILAALALVMNILFYVAQRALLYISYYQVGATLRPNIYNFLFYSTQFILLIAIFALGIILILKQRKKFIIASPIAMMFAFFLAIIYTASDIFIGAEPFLPFLSIFAYLSIILSCVLFVVVVVLNSSNISNRLSFMPWIVPISAVLGYLILFITSVVYFCQNLFYAMSDLRYGFNFIYVLTYTMGSIRSILFHAIFGILFALTLFFAARWITNPYKKSAQIKETDSEQISE